MAVSHTLIECEEEDCERYYSTARHHTPFAVGRAIQAGWFIDQRGRNRLVGSPSWCPTHRDIGKNRRVEDAEDSGQ